MLEVSASDPTDGYERGRSPEQLTSALRREVGSRYVHKHGSVRANFTSPDSQRLLSGLVAWSNQVGREKNDYSFFIFHKKGRVRRFSKKIMKSRYSP